MRRIRTVGVCLVLVFASSAVVTSTASAEAPEFGRCLKVAGERTGGYGLVFHGRYSTRNCTVGSPEANGRFEWYPGAAKAHFTTTLKAGTTVTLETVVQTRVKCTGETSTGEYVSPKLEKSVVMTLTGCFANGFVASSAATKEGVANTAPGEVVIDAGECELGVIRKGSSPLENKLGLTCAEEQEFAWIKWLSPYGGREHAELGLRGWWFFTIPKNVASLPTTTLASVQFKGNQKVEKFVEGPPEPLESTLDGGLSWQRTGLTLTTVQTNEEVIEANSVV